MEKLPTHQSKESQRWHFVNSLAALLRWPAKPAQLLSWSLQLHWRGKKSSTIDSCTLLEVEEGWPFDTDKLLHQKPLPSMLHSIKAYFPSTSSYKYPNTWVWSSCNHGILSCQYHCISVVLSSGYVIPSPGKANNFG